MCGIAGITRTSHGDVSWITSALDRLRHRGQDDAGWLVRSEAGLERGRDGRHLSGDLALMHRRLAIIDLTELGWQPMSSHDGRFEVVFNGEIYNFLELRDELRLLGHDFHSESDTEVLLAAWQRWGTTCLNRFVGMFAFALLDSLANRLFLVRDFFGIKPLYYCRWDDGIGFASEIPSLLELPGVSRRANPDRVYQYLRFGVTDHADQTMFADVSQLPAAHYLEVDLASDQVSRPVRYWTPGTFEPSTLSFQAAAERVRELFLESVRMHLRSDVPVGAALSGGIDSSAIVMAMRYLEPDLEIHAFSYIADDPNLSEERWVDLVGAASGAQVHKLKPSPFELIEDLDHLVRVQGEPFGSTSIYAQYRVFQLAQRAGIKVMLDGQGADELLGGYPLYSGARFASLVRQGSWSNAVSFLRAASGKPGRGGLWRSGLSFLIPEKLQPFAWRLIGRDLNADWLNSGYFEAHEVVPARFRVHQENQVLRAELIHSVIEGNLPMLLRFEDRNSMAYSLESRVPFLTPAFADLLLSLPESYLIAPDGTTKAVFRAAMRGIVPDAVLDRQDKIGFVTPEHGWVEKMGTWLNDLIQSDAAKCTKALNIEVVKRDMNAFLQGHRSLDSHMWRWMNLIAWTRAFDVDFD
jgi:asparagine synthase (glutamine-hydrolysing)